MLGNTVLQIWNQKGKSTFISRGCYPVLVVCEFENTYFPWASLFSSEMWITTLPLEFIWAKAHVVNVSSPFSRRRLSVAIEKYSIALLERGFLDHPYLKFQSPSWVLSMCLSGYILFPITLHLKCSTCLLFIFHFSSSLGQGFLSFCSLRCHST